MIDFKEPRLRVVPSLLSADFARLRDEIAMVEDAGAEVLHLDIMDGHFVPNLSFGVPVVEKIRPCSRMLFDTHAMITDPARYAEAFIKAGTDSFTFHIEASDRPQALVDELHGLGCRAGICLNPGTPASAVDELLPVVDLVLVMSVWPGFGGQAFIPEVLSKVAELRSKLRSDQRLEIDGGIDAATGVQAVKAGADTLVAGSAIFSASDPQAALKSIRAAAEDAYRCTK